MFPHERAERASPNFKIARRWGPTGAKTLRSPFPSQRNAARQVISVDAGKSVRDATGMLDCFVEDGTYDNAPEKKPMEGRAAIGNWLGMCFSHLTRIDVKVLSIAIKGEWVLNERL